MNKYPRSWSIIHILYKSNLKLFSSSWNKCLLRTLKYKTSKPLQYLLITFENVFHLHKMTRDLPLSRNLQGSKETQDIAWGHCMICRPKCSSASNTGSCWFHLSWEREIRVHFRAINYIHNVHFLKCYMQNEVKNNLFLIDFRTSKCFLKRTKIRHFFYGTYFKGY